MRKRVPHERSSVFLRLVHKDTKENSLADHLCSLSKGFLNEDNFLVGPDQFTVIPGSPLSYWAPDEYLEVFRSKNPLESGEIVARLTNGTKNDQRWIRAWWEVRSEMIGLSRGWVSHAKGGSYAPFYSDLHLVIAWDNEKRTYPGYQGTIYRPDLRPASLDYFFRPGLTWSRRANGLSFRVLPRNAIFGDKGPGIFHVEDNEEALLALAAIVNTKVFKDLVALQLARVTLAQSYETGLIQQTPIPYFSSESSLLLKSMAQSLFESARRRFLLDELSHDFAAPIPPARHATSIRELAIESAQEFELALAHFEQDLACVERIARDLYGVSAEVPFSETDLSSEEGVEEGSDEPDEAGDPEEVKSSPFAMSQSLLSWCVGTVFGRWDVRIARNPELKAKLGGPFEPLPVCSPGMLVGPDGLPAVTGRIVSEQWLRARVNVLDVPPAGSLAEPMIPDEAYPLRIDWDGILVDEDGHPDDVVTRVRDVLALLWTSRAEVIEDEAIEILGLKSLREWFRNPKNFWSSHLKQYSKSRRKAPIFWLLQSQRRHYAVLLYYPRLDADTLHKALGYAEERVSREERHLDEAQARASGAEGREKRVAEKQAEQHEDALHDIAAFRDELRRVADFGLVVDHDDGVLLSIAPLHNLVPWPEAKKAWNELVAGKYEWSSISRQMWERGLVEGARGRSR